jgi:hypothetical protein
MDRRDSWGMVLSCWCGERIQINSKADGGSKVVARRITKFAPRDDIQTKEAIEAYERGWK